MVDTYFDVEANQFYRAIENEELAIDFRATNYIQYDPYIADTLEIGETTLINLKEHYQFMEGDTVPQFTGDTLTFSVYTIENPDVVEAQVIGYELKLQPTAIGESTIEIKASAGFTKRVDRFTVNAVGTVVVSVAEQNILNTATLTSSPNPFSNTFTITYEIPRQSKVILEMFNHYGQRISILVDEIKQQGKHEIQYSGKEIPSGVYFCIIRTGEGVEMTKMIKL